MHKMMWIARAAIGFGVVSGCGAGQEPATSNGTAGGAGGAGGATSSSAQTGGEGGGSLGGNVSTQHFTLEHADAPADNPLKGFMPYEGSNKGFPHSLEWFYVPLAALQTDYDSFNWGALDQKIADIRSRGHQAVFRVYLDYPGEQPGVPAFLSQVAKHTYTENGNATSYSPDYEDPNLRHALRSFIAALGARYDGKPEVAFITLGLLGFWGEWHTYPHDWMASPTVMTEVVDAYEKAFPKTHLLAREPKDGVNMNRPRLGFHDDSFAYTTIGNVNWHFWPQITSAGLEAVWKDRAIGGEVRPEVQDCLWKVPSCAPDGQSFAACVTTTHASWMLNSGAFNGLAGAELDRAVAGARSLGYELYVPEATVQAGAVGGGMTVSVTVRNLGVAPFYYPWPVTLGVQTNGTILEFPTDWDLRSAMPGADAPWAQTIAKHGLPAGTHRLVLRVANPMPLGHALRFADARQDADAPEWLTLGDFVVNP